LVANGGCGVGLGVGHRTSAYAGADESAILSERHVATRTTKPLVTQMGVMS